MTECNHVDLRDALPDLIHGRLSELDRATVSAHVEGCAACRVELALLGDVRQMLALTPAPDVARIVAALPAPRVAPRVAPEIGVERPSAFQPRAIWRLAAVAAIVAVAGISLVMRDERSMGAAAERVAVAGQVPLAETPSGAVEPAGSAPAVEDSTPASSQIEPRAITLFGGVQELSDEHLETLLAELDGMESLPAAEPEAITVEVDDLEGIE